MGSLTKLRLTLALLAERLRPKKRRVDFGAPSPHSRRWDEREKAQFMQSQQLRATAGGLNTRMVTLIVVLFAVSLAADLLLPPLVAIGVGLTAFLAVIGYFTLLRKKQFRSYR